MNVAQIVSVLVPVVLALLGWWRAHLESKGKKELAKLVGAAADGIETAGDSLTKQSVQSFAQKHGVEAPLNKVLDAKGYRRNGGPKWETQ